jgi:hypothetical protein
LRRAVSTLGDAADEMQCDAERVGNTALDTVASSALDTACIFDEFLQDNGTIASVIEDTGDLLKQLRKLPVDAK